MRPGQESAVTLSGQTYTLKKMSPEIASFWAHKLLGDVLFTDGVEFVVQLKKFMRNMDFSEFQQLRKSCLSQVFVSMESGSHPLLDTMGSIILPDVSNVDQFDLMMASFSWSMRDFFAGGRMEPVIQHLVAMFQRTGTESFSSSPSTSDTGSTRISGTESTP